MGSAQGMPDTHEMRCRAGDAPNSWNHAPEFEPSATAGNARFLGPRPGMLEALGGMKASLAYGPWRKLATPQCLLGQKLDFGRHVRREADPIFSTVACQLPHRFIRVGQSIVSLSRPCAHARETLR